MASSCVGYTTMESAFLSWIFDLTICMVPDTTATYSSTTFWDWNGNHEVWGDTSFPDWRELTPTPVLIEDIEPLCTVGRFLNTTTGGYLRNGGDDKTISTVDPAGIALLSCGRSCLTRIYVSGHNPVLTGSRPDTTVGVGFQQVINGGPPDRSSLLK